MPTILNYPGSKNRLANIIIDFMPNHHTYLEPFFGSGAVFFAKKASTREILNDIDHRIFNLFKTIREHPEELATAISFTPYSREEHAACYGDESKCPVESARQMIVASYMTHAGNFPKSRSWRFYGNRVGGSLPGQWNQLPREIAAAALRLKDAYIENLEALELIKKYDYDNVFIYADPPYPRKTINTKTDLYRFTMSDEWHLKFLDLLLNLKNAKVLLSSYPNDLYDEKLIGGGWNKRLIHATKQTGTKSVEALYFNYDLPDSIIDLGICEERKNHDEHLI